MNDFFQLGMLIFQRTIKRGADLEGQEPRTTTIGSQEFEAETDPADNHVGLGETFRPELLESQFPRRIRITGRHASGRLTDPCQGKRGDTDFDPIFRSDRQFEVAVEQETVSK